MDILFKFVWFNDVEDGDNDHDDEGNGVYDDYNNDFNDDDDDDDDDGESDDDDDDDDDDRTTTQNEYAFNIIRVIA